MLVLIKIVMLLAFLLSCHTSYCLYNHIKMKLEYVRFVILLLISSAIIGFGLNATLSFFIPKEWVFYDEDGNLMKYSLYISGILGFLLSGFLISKLKNMKAENENN